jgi:hypothetical protein
LGNKKSHYELNHILTIKLYIMKKKTGNRLTFKKNVISNLKTNTVIGGVTGTTCQLTNKYYNTCYTDCPTPATWWDCFTVGCDDNTVRVCDH